MKTMSGLDIITKYPIDKEVDIGVDSFNGISRKGPRWAKRMCMGGDWGVYNIGEEPLSKDSDKPVLTFIREVMILITNQFLDPWGRIFPVEGVMRGAVRSDEFNINEYLFFTTVEGMMIQCGVLVNSDLLFKGGVITKYDLWDWEYPVVHNTGSKYGMSIVVRK